VVRREALTGPAGSRKSRSPEPVLISFEEKVKPSVFRAFVWRRLRRLRGAARRVEGGAGFENHEAPKLFLISFDEKEKPSTFRAFV